MAAIITTEVLEDYLNCEHKAYLRLDRQQGTKSDYEVMRAESRREVRLDAILRIRASCPEAAIDQGIAVTRSTLTRGAPFILDAALEVDQFAVHFDGLKRVDGRSDLGNFQYLPVMFYECRHVTKPHRLLMEVLGLLLSKVQGSLPDRGVIYHGADGTATTVRFTPGLKAAQELLAAVARIQQGQVVPKLLLNDHCQTCEFQMRCRAQAHEADSLSLLGGLGAKEAKKYARKGLLTLTQLAHTFRPRRKGRRSDRRGRQRYHALQALAVRDRRVYVLGAPQVPTAAIRIYMDVESLPDEGFVYLIGMIVCDATGETRHSFWADTKEQERQIFEQFLAVVSRYDKPLVYCYGGYERSFMKRMRRTAERKAPIDAVLGALVNTLSVIYAHFYFPTYSNGLKAVGGCLGCAWSDADASGIQSIAWRMRWDRTREDQWREKLIRYNLEDCAALKRVTEFAYEIAVAPQLPGGPLPPSLQSEARNGAASPIVSRVEELDRLGAVNRRGHIQFFHKEYEYINGCAHFDYQRQRVYIRTSKLLKRSAKGRRRWRNAKLRVSNRVQIVARKCPACGSGELVRWAKCKQVSGQRTTRKRAFDLMFTQGGVRRRVIECRTRVHECSACGNVFLPERYKRLAKHYHGLMSWTMYEHIAHRIGTPMLAEMLREHFGLAVYVSELSEFKTIMARRYRPCCNRLLSNMLAGPLLHVDETRVRLRTGVGYVWVFTTAEEVVYVYRRTREGEFLLDQLKNFKGVLVTDFYAAYDGLACPQQKCLIHLMRDMNQELLNNPFDQELQSITGPFGTLLRDIVGTIDQHGLRRRYLEKHQPSVDEFFRVLGTGSFRSEAADALRARLTRYQGKLFTFLAHDGVPWNNNNAENAIRRFAYYRDETPGRLKEAGLNDYLTLLSLCHTCHYRGLSFQRFLRSKSRDIDAYCQGSTRRSPSPALVELYPKGVVRPDFVARRKKQAEPACGDNSS